MRHKFGMQYRLSGIAAKVFPIFAVVDGVVCLVQPEFLQASMISLSLPTYMLVILGLAKLSGGIVLLAPTSLLLKEWAYAGFCFWWLGGMATHLFSDHAVVEFVPLAVVGVLLLLSFLHHRPRRRMVASTG